MSNSETNKNDKVLNEHESTFVDRHRNLLIVSAIVVITHALGLPMSVLAVIIYFGCKNFFSKIINQIKEENSEIESSTV